jgi:hypothetical protein
MNFFTANRFDSRYPELDRNYFELSLRNGGGMADELYLPAMEVVPMNLIAHRRSRTRMLRKWRHAVSHAEAHERAYSGVFGSLVAREESASR